MSSRRKIILAIGSSVLTLPCATLAQTAGSMPRIGYLDGSLSANAPRVEAFEQGLLENGYVEGKNIQIEWRSAEGKMSLLPALAAELVALKPDLIVSGGPAVTQALKAVTSTIPIVMTADTDPVATGSVASLAKPGGNVTGLANQMPEMTGKQLELLKDVVPRLSRVAVLGNSTNAGNKNIYQEVERFAKALKIKLQYLEVLNQKDIDTAFRSASEGRADAILVMFNLVVASQKIQFIDLAAKSRLPVMHFRSDFVESGGLMAYSARQTDLDRRAASFVAKILKGTKAAELPIEQPTKFELIINMKTAKALKINIPQSVLFRADKVIE
jgi:putative ABC transport system substrate-binding protein